MRGPADPETLAYVQGVADLLTPHCAPGFKVEARVLVSKAVTAHALPGGYLLFDTGLLRMVESEAEFAGVVAQLISYVNRRPDVIPKSATAAIPLIYMGGRSGYTYPTGDSAAVPRAFLEKLAAAVVEADRAAVRCVSAAGYDPEPFAANLRKLKAAERANAVEQLIRELPARPEYVLNRAQFNQMRARVETAEKSLEAHHKTGPPSLARRPLR